MLRFVSIGFGLIVAGALAGWVLLAERAGDRGAPAADVQSTVTAHRGDTSPPPSAPTRGCAQRVEGGVMTANPRTDFVVGPLSLDRLRAGHRDALARFRLGTLNDVAALKSIAVLTPGARVTIAVPRTQSDWLELAYDFPEDDARGAIRLAACRRSSSAREQRAECEWAPRLACRTANTQFNGGFRLDFERAPRGGICAALHIWIEGQPGPLRKRLFNPPRGACDGAPL